MTPEAASDYAAACARSPARRPRAVWPGLVPADAFTGRFAGHPKALHRMGRLRAGRANLLLATPSLFDTPLAARRIDRIHAVRKSPWRMLRALGPGAGSLALLASSGLLGPSRIARILSRRFDVDLRPVLVPRPELALDVDEPEDEAFVRDLLERGSSAAGPSRFAERSSA